MDKEADEMMGLKGIEKKEKDIFAIIFIEEDLFITFRHYHR